MAQSTKQQGKKKRAKTKAKKAPMPPIVIILGILVALMASLFLLCLLFFVPRSRLAQTVSAVESTAMEADQDDGEPTGKRSAKGKRKGNQELPVEEVPSLPMSELTAECFGMENGFKTYRSEELTAALGIDVSSHQGWIDWATVAQSDVDYAMLRAGYRGYGNGQTNPDEYFQYNLESATAAGLDVGIYYFSQAITEEEAIAEAKEALAMVEGYDLAYPIYFDWETVEDSTARTNTISSSELTACALAFCRTIEEAGYQAGIYFNLSTAFQLYQLQELTDYDFWLAEYRDIPSYPFAIDMWQYTENGQVPGIYTDVDLNLSFR